MNDLSAKIKHVIDDEPVALFMKGTPQMAMCGNSMRALEALRRAGAPVTAVDILPDPAIRQELSALSGWPTIPQVFVAASWSAAPTSSRSWRRAGSSSGRSRSGSGTDYRGAAEEKTVALI